MLSYFSYVRNIIMIVGIKSVSRRVATVPTKYRDQIVTMLHSVMWMCLCIPGHIHCSCSTVMALLCIPVSELVSFVFSTTPICLFLIQRIFPFTCRDCRKKTGNKVRH